MILTWSVCLEQKITTTKKNWLCFNSIHVQIRRLYFSNPGSFCHPSKAAAQAALDMNSKKYTPPSQGQCVCVWIQTFAKKKNYVSVILTEPLSSLRTSSQSAGEKETGKRERFILRSSCPMAPMSCLRYRDDFYPFFACLCNWRGSRWPCMMLCLQCDLWS